MAPPRKPQLRTRPSRHPQVAHKAPVPPHVDSLITHAVQSTKSGRKPPTPTRLVQQAGPFCRNSLNSTSHGSLLTGSFSWSEQASAQACPRLPEAEHFPFWDGLSQILKT